MKAIIAAALAGLIAAAPAGAADLSIGLAAAPTSVDPQFYVIGPNSAMARNIFDGLVNQGPGQQIEPALAESWRTTDDTHWEFKVRPGVRFHDGTALTSADVVASVRRVPLAARNSPSSFLAYVEDIQEVTAPDPATVRITTTAPAALRLNNLSRIAILPARLETVPTPELNGGKDAVGTGPFKLESWSPDGTVSLARHDAYWGSVPSWEHVRFRIFTNPSARVAALRAGDVDLIESVPTSDIAGINAQGRLHVVSNVSNRVMYLHLDQARDASPFAKGRDGSNPLRQAKVRRAISLAINRAALVERIMDGQGVPAGQLVPEGYFGWTQGLPPDRFDPAAAKTLLAEAGYPDGFTLTFHASNDRYPKDAAIAQAIAQFLTRAGMRTQLETLPASVYFTRASRLEFSLMMGGAAVETGEASGVLGPLLETYGAGAGAGNRGRYSSPAFDAALREARRTVDDSKRRALLETATRTAMTDLGVIPLFFLNNSWAMRDGLDYAGRSDGYTLAADVRPTRP